MICGRTIFRLGNSSLGQTIKLKSAQLPHNYPTGAKGPWGTRCLRRYPTDPTKQPPPTTGRLPPPSSSGVLGRSFAVAIGGSFTAFGVAFIWRFEKERDKAHQIMADWTGMKTKSLFGDIKDSINRTLQNQFNMEGITDRNKVYWCILGINVLVFLAWKVPTLRPVMMKYFACSPTCGAPAMSMLLSSFSHQGPLHLAVNMYVLYNFSLVMINTLGEEQFSALYVSGGLFSALFSQCLKVARGVSTISVGASGAILAVLGCCCAVYPNSQLQVIFVPIQFSAQSGALGLLFFDTMGVLFKWQIFDHAAHLGGMLFGLFYGKLGHHIIWNNTFANLFVAPWAHIRGP